MKVLSVIVICASVSTATLAGSIDGKATVDVTMENSKIILADVDIASQRVGGGKDTTINSIVVGQAGRIKGDTLLRVDIKDSWIVGGSNATINSIVVE